MGEVILDAFLDTLKIIPVLLLVYLLVNYLTHHKQEQFSNFLKKNKKLGPIYGSALGLLPQCGFSAVMADLYSARAITLGTVMAVFLATSDEAIPLLISQPQMWKELLMLIGIKLVVGILFGYLIDLCLKRKQQVSSPYFKAEMTLKHHNCHDEKCDHHHEKDETEHCAHNHCCADNIFLDAIIHTLKISAFILIINLIIGIVLFYVGIENFNSIISINKYLQPLACALIGLIPNCAASIFLVELFFNGGITFAACLAGLIAGNGIGILILFRKNKNLKENLIVLLLLYVIGAAVGIALTPLF